MLWNASQGVFHSVARNPAILCDMSNEETRHRFAPHPQWIDDLKKAWESLGRKSGRKTVVIERAKLGRSTVNRITKGHLDKVGYDALESLRLSLNVELGTDLPSPAMAMRSGKHSQWSQIAEAVNDDEEIDRMIEWARIRDRIARGTNGNDYEKAVAKVRVFADATENLDKAEAALEESDEHELDDEKK